MKDADYRQKTSRVAEQQRALDARESQVAEAWSWLQQQQQAVPEKSNGSRPEEGQMQPGGAYDDPVMTEVSSVKDALADLKRAQDADRAERFAERGEREVERIGGWVQKHTAFLGEEPAEYRDTHLRVLYTNLGFLQRQKPGGRIDENDVRAAATAYHETLRTRDNAFLQRLAQRKTEAAAIAPAGGGPGGGGPGLRQQGAYVRLKPEKGMNVHAELQKRMREVTQEATAAIAASHQE